MVTNLIAQYFKADHNRLDAAFAAFQDQKRESFDEAKKHFKIFFRGLRRHIVWEEEILFPLFEKKAGMHDEGPTFVMREEHRRIQALLDRIHAKVRVADPDSDDDEEMLMEVLEGHNLKEEQILYPAIDQLTTQKEVAQVFLEMETMPAERYETCCGVHK
jgi:iron-sulfur cluster repair protein YtfE (RIC family)